MADSIGLGRRLGVTLCVALGMGLALGALGALQAYSADPPPPTLVPQAVTHGAVAALAALLLAGFFGRGGAMGWLLALLAAGVVTVVAAALAPQFGPLTDLASTRTALGRLPADLSVFDPRRLNLVLSLVASPFLALLWVALVSAVHAVAGGMRQS